MKQLFSLLFIAAILFSCSNDMENISKTDVELSAPVTSLSGKFIRTANNGKHGIQGPIKLIKEIEFKGKHCQFVYVGTPMSGTFEIDEGHVYITTGSELGILSMRIMNNDHLEGEGYIHGTFYREGTFDPKELNKKPTKITEPTVERTTHSNDPFAESSQEETPKTQQTTSPNSTSESSSKTEQSSNPFAFGGSGGNGSGMGDGPSYGSLKL